MNVIIQLSTYDGNKIQQGEDNMARPTRCRRICMEPAYDSFFPDGFLTGEEVIMTLDEYETIRLIDLEEYTQHECAKQMNISRTTTAEIYKSARYISFAMARHVLFVKNTAIEQQIPSDNQRF